MKPEISVIVPLYNEVENVAPLARQILAALSAEPRPIELVLVDDASTDGTWEQILAANQADPRVRGIRHSRNVGQSAALWTGFRGSAAPVIMTLDGDLQNDPADFPRLLAGLKEYDVVCGMRLARQDNFCGEFPRRSPGPRVNPCWASIFATPVARCAFSNAARWTDFFLSMASTGSCRCWRIRRVAGLRSAGEPSAARGGRFQIRRLEPRVARHLRSFRDRVVSKTSDTTDPGDLISVGKIKKSERQPRVWNASPPISAINARSAP